MLVHTESPDLVDPNPNYNGDSDTALIDMHPTAGFPSNQWTNAAMTVGQVFDDPRSRHLDPEHGPERERRHAGHHDAGRHHATQPSGHADGGRQRHERRAAVDARRQTTSRSLPTPSRATAPCSARRQTTTFADSGLTPGATVNYAVTATDAAGNVGPAATDGRVTLPDTVAPSVPANVTATVTRDGRVHVAWAAATDNVGVVSYRVLRDGTGIAQPTATTYVDAAPRPGTGATVAYSVVAFDQVGNASAPGAAPPLRAALLRQLGASHLKVKRAKKSTLVQVTGTLSDVKAICRLRLGRGAWHRCKVKPSSAFAVSARGKRVKQATLSLRDELGRVRLQTLRVR